MAKAPPSHIEIAVDDPLNVLIEGQPTQLQVLSGLLDRLTLNPASVDARDIKPGLIAGKADVDFWGRVEIKGKNRPADYTVNGVTEKGRIFWFYDVPQPKYDGSIGPWAIPFDVVTLNLAKPVQDEKSFEYPYLGDLNNGSLAGFAGDRVRTVVYFSTDREYPLPVASAATGAAIAAANGGTLSGDPHDEMIIFGVSRPVRLMVLERPFLLGPFSFSKILVRVRSTIDDAGRGGVIAEAGDDDDIDPAEIVVTAKGEKGKKPAYTFSIGRSVLNQCSTLTFDKAAKQIRLSCRPT